MARKSDSKNVAFYSYVLIKGSNRTPVKCPDWETILKAWQKRSFADKTIGHIHYLPDLTSGYPAIGMHKEIDGAFQTLLDKQEATVQDVLDVDTDEKAAKVRADSSVAMFIPQTNYVAVTLGTQHSPRAGSLTHFLDAVLTKPDGYQWKVLPLTNAAKIKEFQESDGVRKVELAFDTTKDLFTYDDQPESIFGHIDALAADLGAEFTVTLTLELTEPYRQQKTARRGLGKALKGGLPRISQAKHAVVYPADENGIEGDPLNLGIHNLVIQTRISTDKIASRTFGNLVTATASVIRERHNELINR